MKGYQLKQHDEFLDGEKRTLVKSLHYKTLEAIDNEVLIDLLKEQASLY